jgi:hypothetical protein
LTAQKCSSSMGPPRFLFTHFRKELDMILKCILAVAFASALIGLGIVPLLKSHQYTNGAPQSSRPKSLKEIARQNKAEGRQEVKLRGPVSEFPGEDMDLDEALKNFTVVVAQPVDSKSYLYGEDGIRTWYRFRIVDMISRKSYVLCYTCSPVPDVPEDLPSLNADEFFLPMGGGTVNLDGVNVTVYSPDSPPFQQGERYLLFVSITPSGVAQRAAGPTGIFRTNDDENLQPVVNNNRHIHAQMAERFNLKLSRLKSHVK